MLAREHELALIEGMLVDLRKGPRAIFVDGEPGIGKSTLLEAAIERARARSITVIRARPTEADGAIANFALLELLADVDPMLVERLPAPQRQAIRVALRWDAPLGRPLERHGVAAAVASLLTAWLRTSPLLMVIDDLHWLDSSSAQALSYAIRRLERLPIGVLAAARSHEGTRPRPLLGSLPAEHVQRIDLGPLPEASIGTLLRDRIGLDLSLQDLTRIVAATTGNPLMSLEVGRAIQTDGMPGTGLPLPVPLDVRVLVRRRLSTLPVATQQQLFLASVQSAPTSPMSLSDVLTPAVEAELIDLGDNDEIMFRHPLYRSAIYTSLPTRQRRQLHADVATQTLDLEERAHHLALATPGRSEPVAQALEQASVAAAARGALSIAADLATRAWHATPPGDADGRSSRGLAAARLCMSAGQESEAAEIAEAVAVRASGIICGHALTIAGQATIWGGRVGDAFALFEQALTHLDDDPATAAFVHMGLAFGRFQAYEPPSVVLAHAQAAVAAAERAGSPSPLAEAQATLAMVQWLSGQGLNHALLASARALDAGHALAPIQTRVPIIAATLEGYCDQVTDALATLEAAAREALLVGRLSDLQYLCIHGVVLSAMAGRHDLLAFFGETAGREIPDQQFADITFNQVAGVVVQRVVHAIYEGREDDPRTVGMAFQSAGRIGYAHLFLAAALAGMDLAHNNFERALTWLEPVIAPVEHVIDRVEPATFHIVPDMVEALAGAGQRVRARQLGEAFHQRCVGLGRRWLRAATERAVGMVDAADGDLAQAHARVSQSIAILVDMDYRIELGRSWLALGLIERRLRRRGAARDALTTAQSIFTECRCEPWRQRVEVELSRTWATRAAPTLTDAEGRIAEMAAAGMNNPEIAAALFISRRTVEATLSKVYRKLEVRGRTELARRLDESTDMDMDQ